MFHRPVRFALVAAALTVGLGFSASAQEAAVAPQAVSPAVIVEKSEEEKAIEAQAVALTDSLKVMQDEIVAAWPDGNFEAILQPRRDLARTLGDRMEAFMKARTASMSPGPERDKDELEAERSAAQVRALPDMVHSVVIKGLRARDAEASRNADGDESTLEKTAPEF